MQVTEEQRAADEAAYADAFNSDPEMAPQPTEDEAFGIAPEESGEAVQETPAAEAAEPERAAAAAAPASPSEQTPLEAAGDAPGADDAVREGGEETSQSLPAEEEPAAATSDVEKERQRLKSWEGRLKKMEADLKAKADAVASANPREANGPADDGSNMEGQAADALGKVSGDSESAELSEAASAAADKIQSGEITPEQAMRQLAEDFGEDFVRMIEAVATAKAKEAGTAAVGEKVGQLGQAVEDIIADLTDSRARAHFEKIAAKHPDFDEIGRSEGFKAFVEASPDSENAKRIVAKGSAAEINKLLDDYKKSQAAASQAEVAAEERPAAKPVVDAATEGQMDAAEGVRSKGMKLPEQPAAAATSYEDAWKEFS